MQSTWWMWIVSEMRGDARASLRMSVLTHSICRCDSKERNGFKGACVSWVCADWEQIFSPVIDLDEAWFDSPSSRAPAKVFKCNHHTGVFACCILKISSMISDLPGIHLVKFISLWYKQLQRPETCLRYRKSLHSDLFMLNISIYIMRWQHSWTFRLDLVTVYLYSILFFGRCLRI